MGTNSRLADKKIVFFDGVCNLCNSAVDTIITKDLTGQIYFASLQSEFTSNFLSDFDLDPSKLDSIIFYENGKTLQKSDAALEIGKYLKGYKQLYFLRHLPISFRDLVYTFIAQNRYRWFGKKDTCRLPTSEEKERFLDS